MPLTNYQSLECLQSELLSKHCLVTITDACGVIVWVNSSYCKCTGFSEAELHGSHFPYLDRAHDDPVVKTIWQAIEAGETWHGELRGIDKQGKYYYLCSTVFALQSDDGLLEYCVSVATDITSSKQAELGYRRDAEHYEQYQQLLDELLVDGGLFVEDVAYSDAALEHLVRRVAEVMQTSRCTVWLENDDRTLATSLASYDLLAEEFLPQITVDLSPHGVYFAALDEAGVMQADDVLTEPMMASFVDTHFKTFNIQAMLGCAIRVQGKMVGLLSAEQIGETRAWSSHDKSFLFNVANVIALYLVYKKQLEVVAALEVSESRLQLSQNFAKIGTWDWNIDDGSLHWSEMIAPLFGYQTAIPETHYDNFIAAVHPEDRHLVEEAIQCCLDDPAVTYDIEHRVVWEDGQIRWLHESGNVIRSPDGAPVRMLGVVRDITESHEIQEQLLLAKEEAIAANKAKSDFLSSMSHELRTPMNAILGFSQLLLLEKEALPEGSAESVEEIYKAGNHLLELINQVLDLARVEAGKLELDLQAVALRPLFDECVQLTAPLFARRNMTLESCSELHGEDKLAVRADPMRLKQVLINLLSNAAKYADAGSCVVLGVEQHNTDYLRIIVRDQGPGLDANKRQQLFQPFNRLDAEATGVEGTGIGLVIAKTMAELMQGRIGVKSQPGTGSTFYVDLPLLSALNDAPDRQSNDWRSLPPLARDSGYQVLYVEDNPVNLCLVKRMVERYPQITFFSASTPMAGLELMQSHDFDLILLDINLPTMSGYEVLKRIRQRPELAKTPVVAVTANAMQADRDRCYAAGFDNFLAKPFDIHNFYTLLRFYLDKPEV